MVFWELCSLAEVLVAVSAVSASGVEFEQAAKKQANSESKVGLIMDFHLRFSFVKL